MRVRTDDKLWDFDRTYLGPKGKPLPVRTTYLHWALFICVTVVLFMIVRQVVTISYSTGAMTIAAGWLISRTIKNLVSPERPLFDALVRGWNDLTAARPCDVSTPQHFVVETATPIYPGDAEPTFKWWEIRHREQQIKRRLRRMVAPSHPFQRAPKMKAK